MSIVEAMRVNMLAKFALFVLIGGSVLGKECPDGKKSCPARMTCCKLKDGSFGCCPYTNAMCCSDQIHCCPVGSKCDVKGSKCISKFFAYDWMVPFYPASYTSGGFLEDHKTIPEAEEVDYLKLNDFSDPCGADETSCRIPGEGEIKEGCCPFKDGVCCEEAEFCCPSGHKCDLQKNICHKDPVTPEPLKMKPEERNIFNNYSTSMCPDGKEWCPVGNTCCLLRDGTFGCCEFAQATCCEDHIHCCPFGTFCGPSGSYCYSLDDLYPGPGTEIKQIAISKPEARAPTAPCNAVHSCPNHDTCCPYFDGSIGCCPYRQATCCGDLRHCCPQGHRCQSGSCIASVKESLQELSGDVADASYGKYKLKHSTLMKLSEAKADTTINSILFGRYSAEVVCSGYQYFCPANTTCCFLADEKFGCCPQTMATCCPDRLHCCPHGSTCDHNRCIAKESYTSNSQQKGISTTKIGPMDIFPEALYKPPVSVPIPFDVANRNVSRMCPDRTSSCSDADTCCLMAEGYGCCPMTRANCCPDHIHCCPHGYTCRNNGCYKQDL